MKILELEQGSPEWLAARAAHFCASEAPAMMGCGKYMTRDELLRQKFTGDIPEVDDFKQKLFDRGHETEALARAIVEQEIDDDLFPVTATDDEGWLLASYDGLPMSFTIGFEHKLWNEELAAQVRAKDIPPLYYWQLEQQILIAGLEKVLFTVSDGTKEKRVQMEYTAVPGRAEQLIAGWKQFAEDLKNYKPVEVLAPVLAEPVIALPSLTIQVGGEITLRSNLSVFGEKLQGYIDKIDKEPKDDQGFANAEAAVKTLQDAQDALEAAEHSALAQTASIDEMRRTVAMLKELARTTRLTLEGLVKAQKVKIRKEIEQDGIDAFKVHIDGLNERLGKPYMPLIATNFAGVMKGKKTIASLRAAVNTELARAKVEATQKADLIQKNMTTLVELASEHKALFADTAQIVLKGNDDLTALVKTRIAEFKEAEEKRLEAERVKIRAEEEARARTTTATEPSPVSPAPDAAKQPGPASPVTTIATGAKPKLVSTSTGPRPADDSIIALLAQHYKVSDGIVIGWLKAMDLNEASIRNANRLMSA